MEAVTASEMGWRREYICTYLGRLMGPEYDDI